MDRHLRVDAPLAALGVAGIMAIGWPAVAAWAGATLALHAWGVVNPRSSFYLPVTWRLPPATRAVFPTFDDGPDPEATPRLLDLLAAAEAHATFFVVGSQVRRHPEIVRRMVTEGHGVGLHSDRHSHCFNLWSTARVVDDLRACADAVAQATGAPAPSWFRPPMGLKNLMVAAAAARLGLRCAGWSAGGGDRATANPARLTARLTAATVPGAILLIHDGSDPWRPCPRPHAQQLTRAVLDTAHSANLTVRALPC